MSNRIDTNNVTQTSSRLLAVWCY